VDASSALSAELSQRDLVASAFLPAKLSIALRIEILQPFWVSDRVLGKKSLYIIPHCILQLTYLPLGKERSA